jgi:hypothetical protein
MIVVSEGTRVEVEGEKIREVITQMIEDKKDIVENEVNIMNNILTNMDQMGDKNCGITFTFKIDKSG